MVANPADLLGPRSETARASERRDQVWGKYVKGEPDGRAQERGRAREPRHQQLRARIAKVVRSCRIKPSPLASPEEVLERRRRAAGLDEASSTRQPACAHGPFRASRSRPSARTAQRRRSCRSLPRIAAWPRRMSACTWAASRRPSTHYQQNPTPNLIIIESSLPREQILAELDRLAENCDPGTKVLVIGHANDVDALSRSAEARRQRISRRAHRIRCSSWRRSPISTTIPETEPVGHVYAFIGAKGGVGSSTICHNAAWALSEIFKVDVVIADLDLAFGTTGLDFNQDPMQGIADALSSPDRLDEVLLDRLLTKCSEHLSIFAAPVVLDRDYDISVDGCDQVIDVVRQNVPYVAVDLPHTWTAWMQEHPVAGGRGDRSPPRRTSPTCATPRTSSICCSSRGATTAKPRLVMNMVNMPKRPEISVKEFESRDRPQGHQHHRFRQRDVRPGGQQRADDRGAERQGKLGGGIPRHRAWR